MNLSGGIVTYIIIDKIGCYYYGENSCWLLDDWSDEVTNGEYFKIIDKLKINPSHLSEDFLSKNTPQLIIDFDELKLYSNYYDQSLENRVPHNWEGVWVEDTAAFLEQIPESHRYWIKLS